MSDPTQGIYLISGSAVPPKNLGDHGYFGLSIDIDRRFDEHEKSLKNGTHVNGYLQHCFNLYGGSDHFIWTIVEKCPVESLPEREIAHIKEGNTYENPKGLNLTPGGEVGVNQAACKPFAFKDIKTGLNYFGTNLAQFCREQKRYDYQQMCRLRRGKIKIYEDLIALDIPEVKFDSPEPRDTNKDCDKNPPDMTE